MARGNNSGKKITQLVLFPDDYPPDSREVKKQATALSEAVQGVPSPEASVTVEPPASEEGAKPPEQATAKLIEERETELVAKYKKDQEARLAALRKARGKK